MAEKDMVIETEEKEPVSKNFIEQEIDKDLAEGVYDHVQTRFPPEPNGYLHIGHAKSILLNYGLAQKYNGKFNLRFDDTNPTKEKSEFVESIMADVKWLGADFEDRLFFASNYFEKMYECAVFLIKKGKAFVCDLSAEQIREYRGDFNTPGKESPYRNRSIEENLCLFEEMKEGKYQDGEKVLRAKIDMASPNINMRDPVIYRVAHMHHHNTGDKWCIYPMYDFAHPIEDAVEHITHSICTLEFEDHRPLYDWVVKECEFENPPRQIEFAKLYLTNVVTGKRYIKKLVEDGIVDGWDDPRLVSIAALRRRGYTPESIKRFVELVGVSKANSVVDSGLLDYCIRDDLKAKAKVVMAVLDPLKLVITNYPEDQVEMMELENNPDFYAVDSYYQRDGNAKEDWWEREANLVDSHPTFGSPVDLAYNQAGRIPNQTDALGEPYESVLWVEYRRLAFFLSPKEYIKEYLGRAYETYETTALEDTPFDYALLAKGKNHTKLYLVSGQTLLELHYYYGDADLTKHYDLYEKALKEMQ